MPRRFSSSFQHFVSQLSYNALDVVFEGFTRPVSIPLFEGILHFSVVDILIEQLLFAENLMTPESGGNAVQFAQNTN
jgi:hypothetical protein